MSRKRKRPSHKRSSPPADSSSKDCSENNTSEAANGPTAFVESFFVDDNGFLLSTLQANLQPESSSPELSWPSNVPTVVKGCRTKYAIEKCGILRLSKPETFRYSGETLIGDEFENIISREVLNSDKRINDPKDIAIAKTHDEERNRGAELIGSGRRVTTNTVTMTNSKTNKTTETHGRNGWMWCTSLEPQNLQEWENWHSSLDPSYDHITTIRSPRAFARALAVIVADQIGPQGDPRGKMTHNSSGSVTYHRSQGVFHGPVVYVDDPYGYVIEATSVMDRALRAAFSKTKEYENQREYRFVIWAHQEPSESTSDLEVSPEMMACLNLA